ncbi:MAG: hypothetical protein M3081_19095 [Gemmatimonadota bacterium]|nr:hypothetical protein [Gemmatimonadota bacterium]
MRAALAPVLVALVFAVAYSNRAAAPLAMRIDSATVTRDTLGESIFKRADSTGDARGLARVGLVQKDARFAPMANGARGIVRYSRAGDRFAFQLAGTGLAPSIRYLVELEVDGAVYTLASVASDARGVVAFDTTLDSFSTGTCKGAKDPNPTPITGTHLIKFWLKRNGNPASGGPPLCGGNGDHDYTYVLLETAVATFQGASK